MPRKLTPFDKEQGDDHPILIAAAVFINPPVFNLATYAAQRGLAFGARQVEERGEHSAASTPLITSSADCAGMALNNLLAGLAPQLKGQTSLSVLKLDGITFRDLQFPNEECYRGGWKDSRVRAARTHPPPTRHAHPPPLAEPSLLHYQHQHRLRLTITLLNAACLPACSLRARGGTVGLTAARTRAPGMRASSTGGGATPGPMAPPTGESGGRDSCRWGVGGGRGRAQPDRQPSSPALRPMHRRRLRRPLCRRRLIAYLPACRPPPAGLRHL